jgi:acyl-CoA reductase-like NAD-dependent aldehyde dehydrogenase
VPQHTHHQAGTTTDYRTYGLWIDGADAPAASGATFEVENPANREIIARVAEARAEDVSRAVAAAETARRAWGRTPASDRFHRLCRLADLIKDRAQDLARWETLATGRPVREMSAQVARLGDFFEYFAATARIAQGEVTPFAGPYLNYTRHLPLGVVGLITPWNHPLLILTKKLAPALAAGNTVVIKPSELTPTTTLDLARLCKEADIPDGVVNVVPGFGPTAGQALATHPAIQKVDLTGGAEAGSLVGARAAAHFALVSLELGGSSPVIVFDDADLEQAAAGATFAAYIAAGQSCVQGARLIVQRSIYDAFAREVAQRAERIRVGDPLDPETQMGPVASCRQYDRVLASIKRATAEGARIATGGYPLTQPPLDRGYHIAPTLLVDVRPGMAIAQEEIFGPVTTMIPFESEDEAIAIANNSRFGLGAAVWTRDVARAHRAAHALESGVVWINDHHRIDPAMPWGGFKDSSTGRETGLQAYRAYTQSQTIVVKVSDEPFDWYAGGTRYS